MLGRNPHAGELAVIQRIHADSDIDRGLTDLSPWASRLAGVQEQHVWAGLHHPNAMRYLDCFLRRRAPSRSSLCVFLGGLSPSVVRSTGPFQSPSSRRFCGSSSTASLTFAPVTSSTGTSQPPTCVS